MPTPTIKIPGLSPLGRPAAAGDLVAGWDAVEGRTVGIDIAELPNGGGGGGGGSLVSVPSPFKVYAGSSNYSYDEDLNSVTVRDARLLNKSLYPVFATQLNMEFDDAQLTYTLVDPDDDTVGNVIISGFKLDGDAHLTITVPGSLDPSGDATYAKLIADVALLKVISAPFLTTAFGANGGKVWWTGDVIPAGWQECIAMRGYVPLAQDPADVYDETTNPDSFDRAVGNHGGNKTINLTVDQLPAHSHFTTVDDDVETPGHPNSIGRAISAVRSFIRYYLKPTGGPSGSPGTESYEFCGAGSDGIQPTLAPTSKTGATADVNIMPPYLIGRWIEFIGI